ncbi:hypothetical protein N7460_000951 [Penicillium canescens]|uniref:Uncharacterized protein n=3 Tax=Penicillium canescens TaxID=5083 RepID=A0AAD6IPL1_PENCN|nr:hypothetical protein N7460_000951 [Penicillium canescens]
MPQTQSWPQSHQITALRLLAGSLYEATRGTTALTNQVQNELALLLTVLDATETYSSSFGKDCPHFSVLTKRLQSCHVLLVDLQKLQLHPDALGAQSQISEIRASLSSLIFGLSEINTNLMVSLQKNVEKALRSLIDNVGTEKQELLVVSDALISKTSEAETDQAWAQLQQDLDAVGISPELSTQNHDFIISALQDMMGSERQISIKAAAAPGDIPGPNSKALPSDDKTSLDDSDDWLPNEPKGLPSLPLSPRETCLSRNDPVRLHHRHSKTPAVIEENLPIPVAFEIQDSTIIRNQSLPREDFPIPVWTESTTESVISSTDHSSQTNPSIRIAHETNPTTLDQTVLALKVTRNKKTNIMSRMLFQMTNSKQKLITPIQKGDLQTVTTLLAKGADANATNNEGQTPLMVAASYGHENIVRILIEYGADMDTQAMNGETALGTAAARGFARIIRVLIASGANVNAGSGTGKTALSQAASYGQDRIVRLLLDCGADIDALNSTGETALALAALNGNMRVARVLLDRGADVDRMEYPWESPLLKAIKQNFTEMVVLLMERGANPRLVGGFQRSETALSYAARLNRVQVLGIFRRYGHEGGPVQYY